MWLNHWRNFKLSENYGWLSLYEKNKINERKLILKELKYLELSFVSGIEQDEDIEAFRELKERLGSNGIGILKKTVPHVYAAWENTDEAIDQRNEAIYQKINQNILNSFDYQMLPDNSKFYKILESSFLEINALQKTESSKSILKIIFEALEDDIDIEGNTKKAQIYSPRLLKAWKKHA